MAQLESRQVVETLLAHMFHDSKSSSGKSFYSALFCFVSFFSRFLLSALYHGLDVMTELVKRHVLDAPDDTPLAECPAALQVIVAQIPEV